MILDIKVEVFFINLKVIYFKDIFKIFIFILLFFSLGCSNAKVDSTPVSPFSITSEKDINSNFDYTIDIPSGWQIVNNKSNYLELQTINSSSNNEYINPSLTIFIPDISGKQSQDKFIKNVLKGTKTNIKLGDTAELTEYNVFAYECTQHSAKKEYPCYYAFIDTNEDFVVIFLSGDMNDKEKLKLLFYNSLITFKKK